MQYKDYYKILGISSSAAQTEIKKAFYKKAMEYHPDRNAGFKDESEKKMKEINEANEALSDIEKRRMYDYAYFESNGSSNHSEKKEQSSSNTNTKNKKENYKDAQDTSSQSKTTKQSLKKRFITYLKKGWQWITVQFKRMPIIIQFWIVMAILGGFISAYENMSSKDIPYQGKPTTIYNTTQYSNSIDSSAGNVNSGTVNDMFMVYCGLNRLFKLHSIAPESKYYKRLISNNSDVSSQIAIAPKLIAERSIIGLKSLLDTLKSKTGSFKNSIAILQEADERMLLFLDNMKYITNFDDFKKNMLSDYAVSTSLINGFPEVFAKDYQNYPYKTENNASILIANGAMMCNENTDISFWDSSLTYIQASSEELGSRRIMQDAKFRDAPGVNGKVMRQLIKGEYITVLDKKKVGSAYWYEISQDNTHGWVSYIAFIDDPSKASAADCDPINGHIDDNGYCSCNDGYKWMGKMRACILASTVSGERILTEMEINIATCGMGGYIDSYNKKCECDWKEGYSMGGNGKCEIR